MTSGLSRKRRRLAGQAGDLMVAMPQVIAARLARVAAAGPLPSARDRREFAAMGTEKLTAFTESWSAMAAEAMRFNQALAAACIKAWWHPWQHRSPATSLAAWTSAARPLESVALDAANEGIAPVRRRAVGNARRLTGKPFSPRKSRHGV
jgi:hypothetical protein